MTAGRDTNRLLWAVGEARRLRRDERPQPNAEGPRGELDDRPHEQPLGRSAR